MPSPFVGCTNIAILAHCDAVGRGHPLHHLSTCSDSPSQLCLLNRMTGQLSIFFLSLPFIIGFGLWVLYLDDRVLYEVFLDGFAVWFKQF
jgi:hypothetical protein